MMLDYSLTNQLFKNDTTKDNRRPVVVEGKYNKSNRKYL